MAIKRALSVEALQRMKFEIMKFEDKWKESFGTPEKSGVWIIWAHSSNGKTRFAIQLAKYLTNFGKVAYDTLEEGARSSFQRAVNAENMGECGNKFTILNREPMNELKQRLRKKRSSPDIIFIDSFQYTGMSKKEYIALKEEFPKKLFILISHSEGKHPEGRVAKFVRYDADLKIRVEGFRALNMGRAGGGTPFTIWEEGANNYWNTDTNE